MQSTRLLESERLLKVSFRQSGGFAPVYRGCELDLAHLEALEADQVRALVASSGALRLANRQISGARDVYLYSLTFQTDRRTHQVRWDQLSVPPAARPLIEFLRAHARDLLLDDNPATGGQVD